jgi:arabinogalactan oligomer/maltooligosaccharide transport system permease protein
MSENPAPRAEPTMGKRITQQVFMGATSEEVNLYSDGTAGNKPVKRAKGEKRRPFGRWFREDGWRHLIAIIVAIFAVFPLLYVLSASLNPRGTLTGSNQLFSAWSLDSYVRMLTDPQVPYTQWYANTLIIAIVTGFVMVFIGALAAYAFSRMRFMGRRVGLTTIVVVQMFPQLLAVVAIFLLMTSIGDWFPAIGLNTHTGLILVYLGGALGVNTFLMYGFFNTIPKELDEAAKIDGAGHARIFFTIILRLVAPILAVVGLLSFIGIVNEYVIASVILIDSEKQTLVVGMVKLVSNPRYADWSAFSAGAVMAAIPVLIVFLLLQRYVVGGLTAGATKG